MKEDVNYTFRERPEFLSPKKDEHIDIDETDEIINPSNAILNKVASRFSPKKTSIFDRISKRRSKRVGKRVGKKISKRSPKRSPKRRRRSRKTM